ncbi:MAG: bifunctional DNA-formamidopyrimidine glycosylase/DNA-(apurinic or apyrimidinic site) lyase [Phycisphaerales bacterium]|nr:bifunctional DNA-formamidopyrimidine glycosylase/DNA-(apurinic or apyrimidinic site) lyase [Phycisphaerales bacterium]
MPELPEVETVRRGLDKHVRGCVVKSAQIHSSGLRWPFQADLGRKLTGSQIEICDRRGKYLLLHLDTGNTWVTHLGMTGGFSIDGRPAKGRQVYEPKPHVRSRHEHVTLLLCDGRVLSFSDPRRFGSMEVVDTNALALHAVLSRLGPEPIDSTFDADQLAGQLHGRRCSIKAAIMNQQIVAGVGNIYACEALHRARISPRRMACTLVRASGQPTDRCQRLAVSLTDILQRAIEIGGSTLRDFSGIDGEVGGFSLSFRAYDREDLRCRRRNCFGVIRRYEQAGRSTFACPVCQR